MHILPLFIAVPLGAAFALPVLALISKKISDWLTSLVTLLLFIGSAMALWKIFPGQTIVYAMGNWIPPIGINLVLDSLSGFMLFTVSLISFAASIYSIPYMERYTAKPKFYTLFLLMIVGMNGVILTGDLFNMFVFIEIAAVASYALVAFGTEHEELEASFKYVVLGSLASSLILLGIIMLYSMTGTLNMADLAATISTKGLNPGFYFCAALFLMGFGLKGALVPFHAWLPDAHPSAPAPISAMLSGVLIKALGIYGIARIFFNIFTLTPVLSNVLLVLGTLSMVIGVLLAVYQWDFKRLLAYHSISQMGYVILGLGLGTPLGIMGGLFHLFNHAAFKSLLFLNSGSVEYATGTRNLKEMGGLSAKMPVTGGTSLIASMSIAGIPPFNGFWSKLIIIFAAVQAGHPIYALWAVLVSLLTLASFLKVERYAFFGKLKAGLEKVKETPFLMGLAMVSLAAICLGTGLLFPYVICYLIEPAARVLLNGADYARLLTGI